MEESSEISVNWGFVSTVLLTLILIAVTHTFTVAFWIVIGYILLRHIINLVRWTWNSETAMTIVFGIVLYYIIYIAKIV
jgi:hypothetical protein